MTDRNSNGTFKKGAPSPNSKGRGNVKNKATTAIELNKFLGRRTEGWFNKVEELGENTFSPYLIKGIDEDGNPIVEDNKLYDSATSLKCWLALTKAATEVRQEVEKDKQNKRKGSVGSRPEEKKEDAPDMTGHLKAVK